MSVGNVMSIRKMCVVSVSEIFGTHTFLCICVCISHNEYMLHECVCWFMPSNEGVYSVCCVFVCVCLCVGNLMIICKMWVVCVCVCVSVCACCVSVP